MVGHGRDVEEYLAVGLTLFLHPFRAGHGQRYRAVVRGWRRNSYILVEEGMGEHRVPLAADNHNCRVRFISEGAACGFLSHLSRLAPSPGMPNLRLAWPEYIEGVPLRKEPRVELSARCEVAFPSGQSESTTLRNLSAHGCAVWFEEPISLMAGEAVRLSFTLPGGSYFERLPALVRSVRPVFQGVLCGCEFHGLEEATRAELRLFMTIELERRRGGTGPRGVLVLDPQTERGQSLTAYLHERGYTVLMTHGILDLGFWLRTCPPAVVLLADNTTTGSVQNLCRLIVSQPASPVPAVVVYGTNDPTAEETVRSAGASAHIPSDTPEEIERVLAWHLGRTTEPAQ
jgi:CheY-like chemotaxis protein/c-di-GMP-binding flagellar brake protein YcgR